MPCKPPSLHEVGWVVPLFNDGGIEAPRKSTSCSGSFVESVAAGGRSQESGNNHWELSLLLSLKLLGWSGCVAKLQREPDFYAVSFLSCSFQDVLDHLSPHVSASTFQLIVFCGPDVWHAC